MNVGFSGWVCYLDADAFVADLEFDLEEYLHSKGDAAFIVAPSGRQPPRWWHCNAGVFVINLGHATGRATVRVWNELFAEISDAQLQPAVLWSALDSENMADDQVLLHRALQSVPSAKTPTRLDDERMLNCSNGRFIRQVLRAAAGTFEERVERLG